MEEFINILESGESWEDKSHMWRGSKKEGLCVQRQQCRKRCDMLYPQGKTLRPKTIGQKKYVESIRKRKDIRHRSAGTGKTYIAVAMAVNAFKNKEVQKIILQGLR